MFHKSRPRIVSGTSTVVMHCPFKLTTWTLIILIRSSLTLWVALPLPWLAVRRRFFGGIAVRIKIIRSRDDDMTIHKQVRELKTNDFNDYFATVWLSSEHTHKQPSLMGKYANGKSRKRHESCESCAYILKSLCFLVQKSSFLFWAARRNDRRSWKKRPTKKMFRKDPQKNIKTHNIRTFDAWKLQTKTNSTNSNTTNSGMPSALWIEGKWIEFRQFFAPANAFTTLSGNRFKSQCLSLRFSFFVLFQTLSHFTCFSLSLSLPNVLESCHWIAFHRFHASSLGALIGHLSIQLQLKLSFRVHRWHSPPSSCRSVESLTNLQKQSNSSKPRRFDFDHSPLPLVSCVQTLEQTFNLSKKYSKIMQTHGFLTVLWLAFRPSVLSVTIVRMCLGVSMQKIEQMQSNCIFWNGTIAILSSFFRVHRVHPVEQYSQRSSNQSASAKWTYEVHAKHLHLDFSWTIGNKD